MTEWFWASRSIRTLLEETKATSIPEKKNENNRDMMISITAGVIFSESIFLHYFLANGKYWSARFCLRRSYLGLQGICLSYVVWYIVSWLRSI